MLNDKIVKIRWVKNYASASNHIGIGRVADETEQYLTVECRTLHFGKLIRERSRINHGHVGLRAIPWNRIEVIHVLDDDTDWKADYTIDADGNLVINNKHRTLIAETKGRHLPAGEMLRQAI